MGVGTFPIHEVSQIELAFPASVLQFMPKWEDIPDEFKDRNTKECRLASDWFFCGLSELNGSPREGVDAEKALKHIQMVLGSFEPKHEHKEAAVAFLLREWFEIEGWKVGRRKDGSS